MPSALRSDAPCRWGRRQDAPQRHPRPPGLRRAAPSAPIPWAEFFLERIGPPVTAKETEGGPGSYCVDYVDEATGRGQGICSDAALPTFPESVTSVARGDRVSFVVPDAILKTDSIVTVRPLGCIDQETAQIGFEPDTGELQWDVDLDPGAYQLDVFARFEASDGRTGCQRRSRPHGRWPEGKRRPGRPRSQALDAGLPVRRLRRPKQAERLRVEHVRAGFYARLATTGTQNRYLVQDVLPPQETLIGREV